MEQSRQQGRVTRGDVIAGAVVLLVLLFLISLAMPGPGPNLFRGQLSQVVGNGQQLFAAAAQMADDYDFIGDETYGWPGELAAREEGKVVSVKDYVGRLLSLDYLAPLEASKILSVPGLTPWDGKTGTFSGELNCGFKIYRVTREDRDATLFAVTRNFTWGKPLDLSQPMFGASHEHHHAFVVIHMDGHGSVYKEQQTEKPELVGRLPGRKALRPDDVETPADSLVQE